jgi:CBS domain-containing protein
MSRSKTGTDREQRNETTQPAGEPRPDNVDERFGAAGYPTGRESQREFPRRSSSLRGRERLDLNRSEDDRLNLDSPRSPQPYDSYRSRDINNSTSRDYRDVSSGRAGMSRGNEGYGQEHGRYGSRGNEGRGSSRDAYREEGYGRHSYDDLASGRADHEDFQRYRRNERADNYTRSDYRTERRDYDEPYNRQALGGRYDAESDYPYTSDDRAYQANYGSGGDYGTRRDARGEERGWGQGRNALRCSEIMTKNVTTCGPDTVIRDVADMMEDDNVGSIPVLDNGRLVGIVTDRDIVCRVIAEGLDTRTVRAREVMSEEIITCTADDSVIDAIRKMGEHRIRRVPICDLNGRLRGIISLGDIALEAERDQDLANALEQISQPTPHQARRV